MGANEIANRMVAAGIVKGFAPGAAPTIEAAGFTWRSNVGFGDALHLILPSGVVPTDPLLAFNPPLFGAILEEPIARSELIYTVQNVNAGEATGVNPSTSQFAVGNAVACIGISLAAFETFIADPGGPTFAVAPTTEADFDPVQVLLIQGATANANGVDYAVTVWKAPPAEPAPFTFSTF